MFDAENKRKSITLTTSYNMKQALLFLSFLTATTAINAQQPLPLPNGDFETWTSTPYDEIDMPWISSNGETISNYGKISVKKIAGFSGSQAIRLETVEDGFDTTAGYITNSLTDIENGEGGVPFTFNATTLEGIYKYNLLTGDTAYIILIFKKNASIISYNTYKITGSQNTATPFSFAIQTMAQAPDTMIIAALSGTYNSTPKHGGWLELDALSFEDGSMSVPVAGGEFENWTSKSIDEPGMWINNGYGEVTKTTDKHAGTYAAKLVSKDDGSGYIEEASITIGSLTTPQIGMPFTKNIDTLTGYYKYTTSGTDAGIFSLLFMDANNMPVGSGIDYLLNPQANYTYFEIPISLTDTPARLMVNITSSDFNGNPVDGSTLYIDDLQLKNPPTSIGNVSHQTKNFVVYPNPATNVLYIKQTNSTKEDVEVSIYNIAGKLIFTQHYEQNLFKTISIPIQDFAAGLYQYKISNGEQISAGKFIKE